MSAVTSNPLDMFVEDPLALQRVCWPDVTFFDKQIEIIESVWYNDETVVPAGNMLGKDFVAAYIVLAYFLTHTPVRIVTTSVKDDHLRVLWGEIGRFIRTSRVPISRDQGGPIIYNHRDLRKIVRGELDEISYLRGMVSSKGEGMSGHHAKFALLVGDEASGINDMVFTQSDAWAKKRLLIGNPNPTTNYFNRSVIGGDINADDGSYYHRKIIRIKAEDSPNVRMAQEQERLGKPVTNEVLLPGVLDYKTYKYRRKTWSKMQQCIGLDGMFYEGPEEKMFPPEWLNRAESIAERLKTTGRKSKLRVIGLDPAEGGDNTVWTIADHQGIIAQISTKTPNTAEICNRTIALMQEHGVKARDVWIDRGGGGKEHADYLRSKGYKVRTVAFGEPASDTLEYQRKRSQKERIETTEVRYTYLNRRAEIYGLLRNAINPDLNEEGFGIPAEYNELRRQLSLIPLRFDGEGRMYLLPKKMSPKKKKETDVNLFYNNEGQDTLISLLGNSPDEADSAGLAIFGLQERDRRVTVSVF